MHFQFYVEKLQDLDKYKVFKNENKKAFPCSCFFVIDKVGEDAKQHFDLWLDKKIFSFQLEKAELVPSDAPLEEEPEEISLDLDFEFNDIEKMIEERMEKDNVKNKVQKYLFSIQKQKGKHYIIGTVFVSNLGMLRVKICLDDMTVLDFEKKSFFDVLKVKGKEG